MSFQVWSKDIEHGGKLAAAQVFNGMGHSGENRSPHLAWSGAPPGTKSFAVTAYDPDAPTGSGWWHWIVLNIPASTHELPSGASGDGRLPAGTLETRTDYGQPGYGGAAPPPGPSHRYIFTVHALDVEKIDLPADASGAMAGFMINAHRLGQTSLTGLYP